jgi:hypothetical protein
VLSGTVVDYEGEGLEGYPIHVWGPTGEVILISGSAPSYGPSGWEFVIPAPEGPVSGTWYLQLHVSSVYRNYAPASPILSIKLPEACREGRTSIHFQGLEPTPTIQSTTVQSPTIQPGGAP